MRRHSALLACIVLTSCVVGTFSIRDEPGAGGTGATGAAAGSGASGASAGSSSGGSANPTGGTSQGGQVNQAGSATLGGEAMGGEPTLPEGGAGMGGDGNGGPQAVAACAMDETGMPPIFCEDFDKIGIINTQKWEQVPGITPETGNGPHGSTGLMHLDNNRLKAKPPTNLDVAAAGGGTTVSFWAKTASSDTLVMWADFGTATNPDVRLVEDQKGLYWRSVQSIQAPSKSSGPGVTQNDWYCVSIYLTASTMTVSYFKSGAAVTSFVVDGDKTAGEDDQWLNQGSELRTIATFIGIGADPVQPGDLYFDDLRIAHGKSNVCGL